MMPPSDTGCVTLLAPGGGDERMSRRAAEAGFESFLDDTLDAIHREFSVAGALQGTGFGAGGAVADRLLEHTGALERHIVEPELAGYREQLVAQFAVLIDYVESDEPLSASESEFLAHDIFVEALAPDVPERKRELVIDDVLESLQRLADGIEPIVERPEDEFWAAAAAAFDRQEGLELIEDAFPFTGPLRGREALYAFEARVEPKEILGPFALAIPSFTVDYTDEAVRAMTKGERRVIDDLKREIEARFEDPD